MARAVRKMSQKAQLFTPYLLLEGSIDMPHVLRDINVPKDTDGSSCSPSSISKREVSENPRCAPQTPDARLKNTTHTSDCLIPRRKFSLGSLLVIQVGKHIVARSRFDTANLFPQVLPKTHTRC